jgi:two-component system KDP operon response regulator KdpE
LALPAPVPAAGATILVVEDDRALRQVMATALHAQGYEVVTVASGRAGLAAANAHPPDVVLLDLRLPDVNGVDVCRLLRRWLRNPIIVVSADRAEDRKVLALDAGADDYVIKPFSMPELQARVRVALRHRAVLTALVDGSVLQIGQLHIDTAGHEVSTGGVTVELCRKEFLLLATFARNCGKVLTVRQLLAQVWGPEWTGDPHTVARHVSTLRRKLGHAPGTPRIVNEAGVGYRMIGAIDPERLP